MGFPPAPSAPGACNPISPGVGGTSACQPHHTTVYPCRIRKPLPGSMGAFGSMPLSLLFRPESTVLRPRFSTSNRMRRLPRSGSVGCNMAKWAENRTLPSSSLGASSRSVIASLRGCSGGTAKWASPSSSRYGPTPPNDSPSAKSSRLVMSSLTSATFIPPMSISRLARFYHQSAPGVASTTFGEGPYAGGSKKPPASVNAPRA